MPPAPAHRPVRRSTAGWWTGFAIAWVVGSLMLVLGHGFAVQARQVQADDPLAEVAGQAFIGLFGLVLTAGAAGCFVAATVFGAVGLCGAVRSVAPLGSGLAALGSLVALGMWFLPWLF